MAENTNTEREALEQWRSDLPYQGATQLQKEAFLAGFRAAMKADATCAPVAEIGSAAGDDAAFGGRAIYPLVDIDGFEYGTKLYTRASLPLPAAGQEPVARVNDDGFIVETGLLLSPGMKLYAAPQPAAPMAGWMPIETAPRFGRILVRTLEIGVCVASAGWDNETTDEILWEVVNDIVVTPTHWMPLPPAPSTEGESNG